MVWAQFNRGNHVPLSSSDIEEIVAELVTRPRHEKVRLAISRLLIDGLGANLRHYSLEENTFVIRGRIDALLGRTIIEIKSDLTREEYRHQLAGYLKDQRSKTGRDYVGIATDGADFYVHALGEDDELIDIGSFKPNIEEPEKILSWLESVVALQDRLLPDVQRIRLELGRESILYTRALRQIESAWEKLKDHPEVALKRQLWDRLLRVAYGSEIDDSGLFLQHTYLVIVAKAIATAALADGLPATGRALLDGDKFREQGINGAVESDFFDWILETEGGDALVLKIAAQANRFELNAIESDVLKGLYESLIDPAQRHDLGEYYTPDWLAEMICAEAIGAPLEQRVIDPSCGSGTFLFQAIRRLIAEAEASNMSAPDTITLAAENVAGIDIHPVAVIFARATWLLALAGIMNKGRPATLSIPVYLGDALQWNARELMGKHELEIEVPPADPIGTPSYLRFTEEVIENPALFDETLDVMLDLAERDRPTKEFEGWLSRKMSGSADKNLVATFEKLKSLNAEGRNHIWGYVARNLSRPIWLATENQKADVVVGNPPWVRYSALSKERQERLKQEATRANVWVGGKAATANDLSAYFFARAVDLYMKRGGSIAFVLPYAAMSRDPYAKFRTGYFNEWRTEPKAVQFTGAWTFPSDVQPLFPVPSCVLFAKGAQLPGKLPKSITRFSGHLPRRDAALEEAETTLSRAKDDWPADTGESASVYGDKFKNGATL